MESPESSSRYFDHNATTPLSAAARETWIDTSDRFWQNPSSLYREAGMAKRLLEDLREELADELGIDEPERVVFTSGATEANNAVMRWAADSGKKSAISAIEHPCVMEAAPTGAIALPVNRETGAVEVEAIREYPGDVDLISLMAANNETGAIQPWEEVGKICREAGVSFHCDAAQWFGKIGGAEKFGEACDFLTGSAHKFGGPKGVGFLVVPESEIGGTFASQTGGPQENGLRAGTEDLAGIAAMMAAFRERSPCLPGNSGGRDAFESALAQKLPGVRWIAQAGERLWNTSMFVLPGDEKNLKWLVRLSRLGFAVSTGSACSSGKNNPSHVMEAMGLDFDEMGRVIRVSGGLDSSPEDWVGLADALLEAGAELLP
ncbi:MAG: aminotransferase class V-fold PLP-dependent enzyme [Verrucomicrobiales bacterium]|nr:aminotransferase class V-fold PLP-dependent enzyme [Verrucomicrobiales bacterium]